MHRLRLITGCAAAISMAATAQPSFSQADNPLSGFGTLGGLVQPRKGIARHEGSWDRSGGNGDARGVNPGQTITLMDYKGAGIVRRFWVTIAPRADRDLHRQAILRMYWDGEETPSVECPVGDFFGVGFGEQKDYISLPLNETSGGYNCYWPMPFHKSARWTLTNLSNKRLDAFYYNIDFTAYDDLPKEMLHFHAQWRRENPTKPAQNYTILEATGRGHFVGTALFMQNRRGKGFGFLEGDEMVHIDGEEKPSIIGTGTEDYFSSGWYFDRGLYSAPYHGVQILDSKMGRVNAYRWHIEDAMPFTKSVKVTIEHGHANDHEADYSSVAYFYQSEPHAPFPALPANAADLLPFIPPPPYKMAGTIEAEDLLASAKASSGELSEQEMGSFNGKWSNDSQLWWRPQEVAAQLTFNLPAPADGTYEVVAYLTKAKDYARIQFEVGNMGLGPEINLYNADVIPTGAVSLGRVALKKGDNPIRVRITGKDEKSSGFLVGIDGFILKP